MRTRTTTALLTLLIGMVISLSLSAQRYAFRRFTTNDGLVQTNVTDIEQDRRGNIWIATTGGLSVFDGRRFTNFDDHDVLQSLQVNALLCDSSGTMWVATQNGLLAYQNSFQVVFQPLRNRRNPVRSLSVSSGGQLLFVCNNQLYEVKGSRVHQYPLPGYLAGQIDLAGFDRDDNLWIVSTSLQVYKKTTRQLTEVRTPFRPAHRRSGMSFLKVLGKEGPTPYFVTNFGTLWVNGDSLCAFVQQQPAYYKAATGQATYVLQNSDTTLWVGGTSGMAKLSPNSTSRFNAANGFCDNSVSCLFTDREQNLWVGTTYNGVYRLSNEALFHIQPDNPSIDLRHVSVLSPVDATNTLVATWGRGLYRYTADSVQKIVLPPRLRYINALYATADGAYIGWFGPGLFRLHYRTGLVSKVDHFATDEAVGTIEPVAGKLVVQTLDNTWYLTDTAFRTLYKRRFTDDGYLLVCGNRILRISDAGGVEELNQRLQTVRRNIFPAVTAPITGMVAYGNNLLLSTVGQGVFLYDAAGRLQKQLHKNNGLPTNIVNSLLVDGNALYLGTNQGLVKVSLPGLSSLKAYKESEGMFGWECRVNGLKKMPDGSLLIATTNGLYRYLPQNDHVQQATAAVLTVSTIRVGEEERPFRPPPLPLPYWALGGPISFQGNDVQITFSGVSQRDPEGLRYHYQLSGADTGWKETANPVVSFRDLPPGKYLLKAFASVAAFQSAPLSIAFTVNTPLSGRWWFQVLLVLLLSGLAWVLLTVANRVYQQYIHNRMVRRLEAEIALKQNMAARSLSFAQHHYKELAAALRGASSEKRVASLTPVFLQDVSKRLELLWKKDGLSLGEFHRYFDELLADFAPDAKVYHNYAFESLPLPMAVAFPLLQLFSLYIFLGLYKADTAVFCLDSEFKSNGSLLMRFYNLTHDRQGTSLSVNHILKDAINGEQHPRLTVDVMENLEFGNMIVAELQLQNEDTP